MEAERGPLVPLLIGFGIAFVVLPLAAFFGTYLLLTR